MRSRWLAGYAALVVVTAALAVVAYRSMFGSFLPFDDEGFALISLRGFFHGGALYDQVSSLYGPGYYVLAGGPLHIFGFAFDGDGARFVNLVASIATIFMISNFLLRRSVLVAVPSVVVGFLVLRSSFDQPLHPGMITVLLLAGLLVTVAFAIRFRPATAMAAAGAFLAAIASIQITVGLLAIAAFAFACVMTVPEVRAKTVLRLSVCALFVVAPWLLLWGNLDQAWAVRCALVVSIGALGMALVASRSISAPLPRVSHLRWLAPGAAAILTLVVAVALLTGTGVAGLLRGWVIDPIGEMANHAPELQSHAGAVVWAVLGLIAAAVVWRRLAEPGRGDERQRMLTGALRTAVGLLIWTSLVLQHHDLPLIGPSAVTVAVPFAWLVLVLPSTAVPDTRFIRTLIGALALVATLPAYPAGGDQSGWTELLLVLVGGVSTLDGIEELTLDSNMSGREPRALRIAALVPLAALSVWAIVGPLRNEYTNKSDRYRDGVPPALPGVSSLRLPATQAHTFERLTADLDRRCGTFLTIPGMYSLDLFARQRPPTQRNLPTWMWDLGAKEQREVVDQVEPLRALCVVRNRSLIGYWEQFLGPPPDRPLLRFVDGDFRTVERVGGYELMTKATARRR